MRLGLDLCLHDQPGEAAAQADKLGLWAVVIGGPAGTEAVRAAQVITGTSSVRVMVEIDIDREHPFTVAEELSVLDNLSGGRVGAILLGDDPERAEVVRRALLGHLVNGVMLTPPTVQTVMTTWLGSHVATRPEDLGSPIPWASPGRTDLGADPVVAGPAIDGWLGAGCTHLIAQWNGDLRVLARHLATRAATASFPGIVAELADRIAPFDG